VIEARGVSKTFGRRMVLNKVDIDVGDGEVVALIGPNGAGKTTLLRILASLLEASSGEVYVQSKRLDHDPVGTRRAIGYIGHSPYVYDDLSALENLAFYWSMYGLPRDRFAQAGPALLRRVGLSYRMHDKISVFSRGMKQRLAIARAILHSPQVLLMDEPFSSLDQNGVETLSQIISEERDRGKSIVIVTHDIPRVSALASRAVVLQGGRVVGSYDTRAIVSREFEGEYRLMVGGGVS
jgi:heme ABC exporter ATP-binding subunit CcmA